MTIHDDDKWLEIIYRQTFPILAAWIQRAGGDLNAAKDIFHDALLIYMEKQADNTLNIRTTPQAYIAGIARILWIKKIKGDHHVVSLDTMNDVIDIPEEFFPSRNEQRNAVVQSLQKAGNRCMELLQAFYYQRWSMQRIANVFNYKTEHSATVQKYKCLEKVREHIKKSEAYENIAA